jgi:response regulator NasT
MFLSAFSDQQTVEQVKALGAIAYLVKPLDIGQIVPTVEAAFAALASREAPAPGVGHHAASNDENADVIPIAIGIVMHRYSLSRQQARERLAKLAQAEGRSLQGQAERLVAAVELLALPGQAG